MGRAVSHFVVYEHAGRGWVRDIGQWDSMPWHLAAAYRAAGRDAQADFWGYGDPSRSMLAQMGMVAGQG